MALDHPATRIDAVSFAVRAQHLAVATIADRKARHDAWLHLEKCCRREADREMEELKREARLDWRRPDPIRRTPSGTFQGVGEALKEGGFTEKEPDTK